MSEPLPIKAGRLLRGAMPGAPALFALTVGVSALMVWVSHQPLWHTDFWGHLAYGRWIVETGRVPRIEPLMPLAAGQPMVDAPWFWQVLTYWAYSAGGVPAIQFLFGATVASGFAALGYAMLRRDRSLPICLIALGACLWLEWQQLLVVRPQWAGFLWFMLVFVLATERRARAAVWIVPAICILWANMHASLSVGLALLGGLAAGRWADVVRRSGSLSRGWADRRFRRLLLLIALASVAGLVNPYGWRIYATAWQTASQANLASLVEWQPLTIEMKQGQAAAVVTALLAILYFFTPRRTSLAEPLLLFGLGLPMLLTSRMIVWWSPIAAYYLAVHAHAVWRKLVPRRAHGHVPMPLNRRGWTTGAIAAVGIACLATPLGMKACGRRMDESAALSAQTPIGAAKYLREHPADDQLFNTYEWGDYLLWAGPRDVRVFVASHAHLIPPAVWRDYLLAAGGTERREPQTERGREIPGVKRGWQEVFADYNIRRAVIEPWRLPQLTGALRGDQAWKVVFEDDRSIIFERREL